MNLIAWKQEYTLRCDYRGGHGEYHCPQESLSVCEECREERCAMHLRVCQRCGKVFCAAPLEQACWQTHLCMPNIKPEVQEFIHDFLAAPIVQLKLDRPRFDVVTCSNCGEEISRQPIPQSDIRSARTEEGLCSDDCRLSWQFVQAQTEFFS